MRSEFRRDSIATILRFWNKATPEQRNLIYIMVALHINLARLGLRDGPEVLPEIPNKRPAICLN